MSQNGIFSYLLLNYIYSMYIYLTVVYCCMLLTQYFPLVFGWQLRQIVQHLLSQFARGATHVCKNFTSTMIQHCSCSISRCCWLEGQRITGVVLQYVRFTACQIYFIIMTSCDHLAKMVQCEYFCERALGEGGGLQRGR